MKKELIKEIESSNVGSRWTPIMDDDSIVLERDVDRQYAKFEPLRKRVFYSNRVVNGVQVDSGILKSYIDEQFVRLVAEYDIGGTIDFTGYIAKLLPFRVHYSFAKKEVNRTIKQSLIGDDNVNFISDLQQEDSNDIILEEQDLIVHLVSEFIVSSQGYDKSPLREEVLKRLSQGEQISRIVGELTKSTKFSRNAISNEIKELRNDFKEFAKTNLTKH
ncbi:hypothetical protein RND61_15325 [Streptomyces sp. TRM76323]|uniref:Uncharacterized protein n=1 Tax=Streptomyces tamarix TaxID=3078565 RepID=A0ABU3QLV2_9ACTN|nr:hypothetical protein [Streptomyces tamarix]MDT9683419.1 hypothetical protein [Streptomyces tamarix]